MTRPRPPFRADQVGSLLRPAALKEMRARVQAGTASPEDLHHVEDDEIRRIIRRQEEIGLQAVTDGEFRRSWWHFDFLKKLDGVEGFETASGIQFQGVQTRAEGVRVTGRIGFSGHPMIEHFRFLRANTKVTPKMTIPSPSVLHFRGGRKEISTAVYPHLDAFFDDLARAYRKVVKAFYEAGCRYLQFDDTVWAYLCSKEQLHLARQRGEEVEKLPRIYADVINHAIADRPHDMVITTHVCRGNFRSTWVSEGGYEPIAERLLAGIDYDGYFLEYDTERAGGFEPLRFLPKGRKMVVLGLVTTKSGTLENTDAIERRIEEASKYVALDQLALSPQCGFASTEEGNLLSEEEQWAKLAMIVELAADVWG
ncbi:5-methyltetrahydropteroyltriglutamate--homocysteine S-methyltransferase [Rhodoplanes serenus]|jgi:5-methyltetrahydropteroyltriglutamate--homocysteine methyltransferase|uniref:5-methyltetrahydropteroyltriglutamate--homocystei ne methyltransferase n=1 Tax=Rhodoplanes serenus TaxID=200615 RepID=A0A327KCH6_9BRAD|nr:cobalamin-independent methionine synthase II family protein [Rhodoplanes serenus]MTW17577.1 5-methyltetrahydropteroyltriglutamate--homocysteine S-methyltransferase [Rhodoplanes serenus]RAI36047.1 5-methyltetrahydropteroyltriglutamate--homocysteine S-methyltransferase [Rhodoplanes serenus]VCU11321.1 5-methyltetrahydropteroyltriglutamate--homocysteine methyltransferase [Rhodoplanes serenus]